MPESKRGHKMSFEAIGMMGNLPMQAAGMIGGTAATPGLDGLLQELWKVSPTRIPDLQPLIHAYWRGIIDKKQLYDLGARNGWREENIDSFLQVAKVIPGVSDQVRFVVKEAYTPELVQDLTKGEETPPKFIEQMSKIGVDKEDSDRFWTAHYDPLGRGDYEEMFHRLNPRALEKKAATIQRLGLDKDDIAVDLDFLKRMLRLRDIYPGLRDRVAMMSYKPISRIDIRRLEDFGLLTKDDLIFRNEEIGYSPEDAEFLAKWTMINNEFKDIRALLRQNAIDKDQAVNMLIEVGATKEDAERLILRVLPKVKKEKLAEDKELSKSEFLRAYRVGIRERAEVKAALIEMNYDEDEAEFLLELEDVKLDHETKETKAREKDLTKSDITKSFKQGTITVSQMLDKLKEIGYDEDEAEFIADIAKIDKEKAERKK